MDTPPSLNGKWPDQHGQGVSMAGENPDLEKIAAGIADDAALDWRLLSKLDANAADAGDGLRELSQLAQVFRGLQLKPERAAPSKVQFRFAGLDVLELLGAGAQGEVWRAYDPMLDQEVALKLRRVDSDTLSHHFLAEGRRLAKLRHPNIVSVYGAAAQDGRVGLWIELVRGRSLAELLQADGPFSATDAVQTGIELCRGLAAVHRLGLTHGDVKAENVLRDVTGRVVLADFGAAREFERNSAFDPVSGTRQYLAPEVLAGENATPASDQFAVGVLLYRLLSGRFPYASDDLEGLRLQQVAESRRPLRELRPDLPRALTRTIERALAPDPARRHAGVLVLLAALEASLRPWRVRPAQWAGIAAACALFAAAAVFWRPVPAPSFALDSSFYRDQTGQRERLADGATIAVGDRLRLDVATGQPTWIYVFNDDGAAAPTVLFPLPGIAPANPLRPGTRWQLPGHDGVTALSWQVDREAERETFVIVASSEPLPHVEARIAEWNRAMDPAAVLVARGVGRLAPAQSPTAVEGIGLSTLMREIGCDAARATLQCERFVFPHARR
jgi:eukaryotic-like serine/threonine-protein kinase